MALSSFIFLASGNFSGGFLFFFFFFFGDGFFFGFDLLSDCLSGQRLV